jgi:hypothetical protein
LQGLEVDVHVATGLRCTPDVGCVLDWDWPLAVEGEILEVGLAGDPRTAASRQVYQKQCLEDGRQGEALEAVAELQAPRLVGVVAGEGEAEP